MGADESSLGEIRTALSSIARRLDALSALVTDRPAGADLPGTPLDEATRARLGHIWSLLALDAGGIVSEVYLLAVDRVIHHARADCAAVFVTREDGQLEVAAHRGLAGPRVAIAAAQGIVGRALRAGEPIQALPGHAEPLVTEHALQSAVALPIGAGDAAPLGVLFAGRRRPVAFDVDTLASLLIVADRLAGTLRPPATPTTPAKTPPLAFGDLDLGSTARSIATAAAVALGAGAVAVLLPEADGLELAGGTGLPADARPPDVTAPAVRAVLASHAPWTAETAGEMGLSACLGEPGRLLLPLVSDGALVALLAVAGPPGVPPHLPAPLAASAAVALRNARIYRATARALAERSEAPPRRVVPPAARDLGGLLAVVLGRLATSRERVTDSGVRHELAVAEEAAWRAAEAVRGLLGFAPGRRGEASDKVDLAAIARERVEAARQRDPTPSDAVAGFQLQLEPVPPISADPADLRDAVDRLLENAREAGGGGDPILVRTRWDGAGRVELVIEDHGSGMDESTRERALEPFFSTKGPGRLGLGLPVVQAVLTRHHGALDLRSAPGRGTTVRLTLPTAPGGPVPPPGGRKTARILLVEDEAPVRDTLVEALTADGHTVRVAADGQTALALLGREPLDLLVTDLALPGASGLEIARAAKRIHPGTLVVLITGWPGRVHPDDLDRHGVDAVIEKPVGLPELRERLAALLGGEQRPG